MSTVSRCALLVSRGDPPDSVPARPVARPALLHRAAVGEDEVVAKVGDDGPLALQRGHLHGGDGKDEAEERAERKAIFCSTSYTDVLSSHLPRS